MFQPTRNFHDRIRLEKQARGSAKGDVAASFWYYSFSSTINPERPGRNSKGGLMATKKGKKPEMSKRQQRRLRTQQIVMGVIAVLLILAFIAPYFAR